MNEFFLNVVYVFLVHVWGILFRHKKKRRKSCHLWQHGWSCYAKWNEPDKERQIVYYYHLKVESKKSQNHKPESRMVVARGWGWKQWEVLVKGHKLLVIRWISSGDLMVSMVTIVNNTVLHTWHYLRKQMFSPLKKKKVTMWGNRGVN